jgi:hypothetical protein
LIEHLCEGLVSAWDAVERAKEVWVLAVKVDRLAAIGPYTDGRSLGIAVAFELL